MEVKIFQKKLATDAADGQKNILEMIDLVVAVNSVWKFSITELSWPFFGRFKFSQKIVTFLGFGIAFAPQSKIFTS